MTIKNTEKDLRITVSFTLPSSMVEWIKSHDLPASRIVEEAIKAYRVLKESAKPDVPPDKPIAKVRIDRAPLRGVVSTMARQKRAEIEAKREADRAKWEANKKVEPPFIRYTKSVNPISLDVIKARYAAQSKVIKPK